MVADIQAALPAPLKPSREAKLLIQEAQDTLGVVKNSEKRSESKVYVKNYTGERLLREEPRRYRLIASMRAEGLGMRATCRAAHCNAATVAAVERAESQTIATVKKRIAATTARVAHMSIERIEEEIKTMPVNLLGMTFGIAVDKLQSLTGDPQTINVQHTITPGPGLFERFASMTAQVQASVEKVIQAKVIESTPIQIEDAES